MLFRQLSAAAGWIASSVFIAKITMYKLRCSFLPVLSLSQGNAYVDFSPG